MTATTGFTDFCNIHDNPQFYNFEPHVILSGVTGTTKYTGTSMSGSDKSQAIWSIQKEWQSGNISCVGYPNGDSSYAYIWNSGKSYTYF